MSTQLNVLYLIRQSDFITIRIIIYNHKDKVNLQKIFIKQIANDYSIGI